VEHELVGKPVSTFPDHALAPDSCMIVQPRMHVQGSRKASIGSIAAKQRTRQHNVTKKRAECVARAYPGMPVSGF
jgi:hypothetical protein